MPFNWYGYETGNDLIWEQEIKRYYFVSGQEVKSQMPYGIRDEINIGTRVKLTKAEANKFYTKGFIEYRFQNWDATSQRYKPCTIPLSIGEIVMQVERRELRQFACTPEDVAPPKRKKKK